MKLRIVAIGVLPKKGPERALCDDYLGRIERYSPVEEIELKPGAPPRKEAAALTRATDRFAVVVLDEAGAALTSVKLARRLEQLASSGKGQVAVVLGGAHGLPRGSFRGAERWSLSPLTLPHRLARVVLCEQLYRALTILRGEPYHH